MTDLRSKTRLSWLWLVAGSFIHTTAACDKDTTNDNMATSASCSREGNDDSEKCCEEAGRGSNPQATNQCADTEQCDGEDEICVPGSDPSICTCDNEGDGWGWTCSDDVALVCIPRDEWTGSSTNDSATNGSTSASCSREGNDDSEKCCEEAGRGSNPQATNQCADTEQCEGEDEICVPGSDPSICTCDNEGDGWGWTCSDDVALVCIPRDEWTGSSTGDTN